MVAAVLQDFVFRSYPHIPAFQDYTETNCSLVEGLSVEEAAEIFLLTFPSVSRVFPLPKECVAVPRQSITCHVCKTDLYRMSPNYCDKCWAAYFKPVQDLIKQEELEKIAEAKAKAAKKKKKGLKPDEDEGNDNAGMLNPNEAKKTTRSWRPPKAPKVRQTWKKGKK